MDNPSVTPPCLTFSRLFDSGSSTGVSLLLWMGRFWCQFLAEFLRIPSCPCLPLPTLISVLWAALTSFHLFLILTLRKLKVPRRSVRQEAEVSVGVRNTFLRAYTVWLPSAKIPQWIAHLRTPMATMCCRKLMTFMYLLKTQWRWEPLWLSTHIILKTALETGAVFTEVRSSASLTRLEIQGGSIPAKANILSSSTANWPYIQGQPYVPKHTELPWLSTRTAHSSIM